MSNAIEKIISNHATEELLDLIFCEELKKILKNNIVISKADTAKKIKIKKLEILHQHHWHKMKVAAEKELESRLEKYWQKETS